jgi:hypothetical protein
MGVPRKGLYPEARPDCARAPAAIAVADGGPDGTGLAVRVRESERAISLEIKQASQRIEF